jgi:hypothetical protein
MLVQVSLLLMVYVLVQVLLLVSFQVPRLLLD